MSYCIAELELTRGKREVAVVHRRWICGEQFYYPNFWRNKSKLTEALTNGWNPEKSWLLYNGHIVGNKFYNTYEVADSYLSQAENGSDFSSSEGLDNAQPIHLKKRKCNSSNPKPVVPAEDSESDGEDDIVSHKKPNYGGAVLPPPPTVGVKMARNGMSNGPSLVSVNFMNDKESELNAPDATLYTINSEQTGLTSDNVVQLGIPVPSTSVVANSAGGSSSEYLFGNYPLVGTPPLQGSLSSPAARSASTVLPIGSSPSPAVNGTSVYEFPFSEPASRLNINSGNLRGFSEALSTLQHGQLLLTAKVEMCLDLLRTVVQKQGTPSIPVETGIRLPISSIDEFDALNTKILGDRDARSALIDLLSVKGGNTSNQVTYRVMSALLLDDVMQSFTMAGQRDGKRSFRDSVFLQCICDAVRKSPKGSVATDKEIEAAIEYWLKRAKSRLESHARRQTKGTIQRSDESQEGD